MPSEAEFGGANRGAGGPVELSLAAGKPVVEQDLDSGFDFVHVRRIAGVALAGLGELGDAEAVAGFGDEDVQDHGRQGVAVVGRVALGFAGRPV